MALAIAVSVGWILAICVHEFCHALVAYVGGDKSVKEKGYLTLNPIKYTDPGLSLVVPLIMLMLGGIALPGAAVYINRNNLRNRFWHSAVSAAGPTGTAIMVVVFALPFTLGLVPAHNPGWFFQSLALLVLLQVVAFVLNSLPIPPLDGYGVIEPWLPLSIRKKVAGMRGAGIWLVFGLLWFVKPLNQLIWGVAGLVTELLGVPLDTVQDAYSIFMSQRFSMAALVIVVMIIARSRDQNATTPAVQEPEILRRPSQPKLDSEPKDKSI